MKRKHDYEGATTATAEMLDAETTFSSLGLDARLLQGVATLGFANPTFVQAKAIPLALEGKDIFGMPIFPVLEAREGRDEWWVVGGADRWGRA
jgi:hypothetical protein